MELNRQAIKGDAAKRFVSAYWPMVGITVLAGAIGGACGFIGWIGYVATLIIIPVISVGFADFNYRVFKGEKPEIKHLFQGFSDQFGHLLGGYWYMALFTWLWSLLFVIPGIIKGIAYSMTPYILADQPEVSATDALKESMRLTDGHKWEIFVFDLSFLGWEILGVITLGLVWVFYAGPYYNVAKAGIYEALKQERGKAQFTDGYNYSEPNAENADSAARDAEAFDAAFSNNNENNNTTY